MRRHTLIAPPLKWQEGDVALSFATSSAWRILLVMVPVALYLTLSVAAARRFGFEKRGFAKAIAIYLLSLAVGVAFVLIDEAIH